MERIRKVARRVRRAPTRRERITRRVDYVVGRMSWKVTRWWARGLGGELKNVAARVRR